MLPQRNAKLLQVNAAGTTPDWDSPDAIGPEKFKGGAPAYYTERRERSRGPAAGGTAAEDMLLRRWLIVEPDHPEVQFEEGDVLRFSYRGTERTGVVDAVEERDLPGKAVIGSIRLTLKTE